MGHMVRKRCNLSTFVFLTFLTLLGFVEILPRSLLCTYFYRTSANMPGMVIRTHRPKPDRVVATHLSLCDFENQLVDGKNDEPGN